MEAFDPGMFPHRVFFLPDAEGQDGDAGVTEAFPGTSGLTPLPCRIRLLGSRYGLDADQETGHTPANLAFPADPGCGVGDRFRSTPGNRTFRAIAPAQARDADGVLWIVACECVD